MPHCTDIFILIVLMLFLIPCGKEKELFHRQDDLFRLAYHFDVEPILADLQNSRPVDHPNIKNTCYNSGSSQSFSIHILLFT